MFPTDYLVLGMIGVTSGTGPCDHVAVSDAADEDSRLLLRSATEPALVGELYRRNQDPLLGWFMRRTLDAEVAADLAAETWATVVLHRDRFDAERGTATAFIWGVAKNVLQNWWRQGAVERRARERLGMPILEIDDEAIAHVESLVDLRDVTDEIASAICALPEGERAAVELRVVEGLDYREVAARLDCQPGAARVRVSRGLARLRDELQHLAGSIEV